MSKHIVKPHLLTTNVYVQQQILQQNIKTLKQKIFYFDSKRVPYQFKMELERELKRQKELLKALKKTIAKNEQLTFGFGGFNSNN